MIFPDLCNGLLTYSTRKGQMVFWWIWASCHSLGRNDYHKTWIVHKIWLFLLVIAELDCQKNRILKKWMDYPPVIKHGNGTYTIYSWFSYWNSDFESISHLAMFDDTSEGIAKLKLSILSRFFWTKCLTESSQPKTQRLEGSTSEVHEIQGLSPWREPRHVEEDRD